MPAALAGVRCRQRGCLAPWRVCSCRGNGCRTLMCGLALLEKTGQRSPRCRIRSRSFQTLAVFRAHGAQACRKVKLTRSTNAGLLVRSSGVRHAAPSTTRVLRVSNLPCGFCCTNGP